MFTVDTLDNVEETEKQFFEQTEDGKFKFSRAKVEAAAKAGLEKKNRELLGKLAKSKGLDDADLERIKKLKANPDRLSSFDEWLESQDDDENDDEGDKSKKADPIDAKKLAKQVRAELKKEFDAALKAKDDELAKERARFDQYQFELKLAEVADAAGVVRMKQFKALNALDKQFGWKDGKLIALDSDGEESTDSVDERFKQLFQHADWQNLFAAKEPGGGSGEHKGKPAGKKPLKRSEMSAKEKSDYIKEHGGGQKGMDAFLSLPLK